MGIAHAVTERGGEQGMREGVRWIRKREKQQRKGWGAIGWTGLDTSAIEK